MTRSKPKPAQPRVVCKRDEHTVSRKDMDPDALKVLYRLNRADFTAYLVGGGVRDLLLGRAPKDFDISTDASPRQIRKLFRNAFIIGRRFRLVHVRFGEKVIEVSTFRSPPEQDEQADSDGLYHHVDNTFGTPEEDAWRRDFTVNALFYDVRTFEVLDHVGGLEDLKQRVIRCIGDPDVRFQEDPVRMLRAVRFSARLDFEIEQETCRSIQQYHDHLGLAPAPRLLEELYKLFIFGSGSAAIEGLLRTGLLPDLLPELEDFLNANTPESALFWRLLAVLDKRYPDAEPPPPEMIFAVLFLGPHLEEVALCRERNERVDSAECARRLFEPLARRLKVPKRIYYRVVQLLDAQRRFSANARRFSKSKFASQAGFTRMLELREIHLEALGEDLGQLNEWRKLADEVSQKHADAEDDAAEDVSPRKGKPRRRGRRRRRRTTPVDAA